MDIRKRFGTDRDLEESGVWQNVSDTCSILVARMNNARYNARFQELAGPKREIIRRSLISNEDAEELLLRVMSETILLDWKGVTEDGKPFPYTRENAYRLLKELPDFRMLVQGFAETADAYKKDEIGASVKNL
jgi:hypothetical protein